MSPNTSEKESGRRSFGLIRDLLEWQLWAGLLLLLPATFLFLAQIWVPIHYTCLSMPPDDRRLERWLDGQEGISPWRVERQEGKLVVSFMIDWFSFVTPDPPPPLDEMGYDVASVDFDYPSVVDANFKEIRRKLQEPWVVIVTLLSFQLPMLWIVRRRFKRGELRPPNRHGWRSAAGRGFLIGLGLFGVILVYRVGALWLGADAAPAPWPLVASFPFWAQMTLLGMSLTVTPLCEEPFLRGIVFGFPASAGNVVLGTLLSVPLYAAMHYSLISLPLLILMGWALTRIYRSSRHLAMPLSAHATAHSLWMMSVML